MAAMSRETRRIVVAHLTDRGMNPADIADELGVSRETVRRDLHSVETPNRGDTPTVETPDVAGLLLPESTQLRQDLNLLAASYKAQREDVARFAIHQAAEAIRGRMHARFAANNTPQEARS